MSEVTLTAEEVKARWYEWAKEELGGTPARLEAIASVALNAVVEGLDSTSVMDAARRAATAYAAPPSAPPAAPPSRYDAYAASRVPNRKHRFLSVGLLLVIIGAAWLTSHTVVRLPIRHIIVKPDVLPQFNKSKR